MVIATKCGIHYENGTMITDGRPERILAECDESLRRLGTDRVELLYLHAPDEKVPIADSAAALRRLMERGKTLSVGASNCTIEQMEAVRSGLPDHGRSVALQHAAARHRTTDDPVVPRAQRRRHGVLATDEGLARRQIARDRELDEHDSRRKYPMYQGDEWQKNQDFIDRLREIASSVVRGSPDPAPVTVAQLVVHWTFSQPGITSALCGAKRPQQIEETAGAMGWQLTDEQRALIDAAIAERGPTVIKRAFS